MNTLFGLGAGALAFLYVDRSASARTPDDVEEKNKAIMGLSFEACRPVSCHPNKHSCGWGEPYVFLAYL